MVACACRLDAVGNAGKNTSESSKARNLHRLGMGTVLFPLVTQRRSGACQISLGKMESLEELVNGAVLLNYIP